MKPKEGKEQKNVTLDRKTIVLLGLIKVYEAQSGTRKTTSDLVEEAIMLLGQKYLPLHPELRAFIPE